MAIFKRLAKLFVLEKVLTFCEVVFLKESLFSLIRMNLLWFYWPTKYQKKNQTHSIFFLILFLVGTKLIYTNWAMLCLTYTCFFFLFLSKRAIATCRPSKNIYVQKSISYPCESVIFLKLGNCEFLFFFFFDHTYKSLCITPQMNKRKRFQRWLLNILLGILHKIMMEEQS